MSDLALDADGLAHVPSAEELARRGMARGLPSGKWTILPAGDALLREVMAHNARVLRENPDLRCRLEAAAFKRPGL